jgi:hypothetical protein
MCWGSFPAVQNNLDEFFRRKKIRVAQGPAIFLETDARPAVNIGTDVSGGYIDDADAVTAFRFPE